MRVETCGSKKRTLRVYDTTITLPDYKDSRGKAKPIMQVAIQGKISIKNSEIKVDMKKRWDLPLILEIMNNYKDVRYDIFEGRTMKFIGATST